MIMVVVQVTNLSHENFKSSRVMALGDKFWCQVKSWRQTRV